MTYFDYETCTECGDQMICGGSCAGCAMSTPADDAGKVHYPTTPVQCACGWRQTDPDAGSWQDHMVNEARTEVDRLRVTLAAVESLVERTEKAAEDSLSRTLGGDPFPGFVMVADLRKILAADPVSLADVRSDHE